MAGVFASMQGLVLVPRGLVQWPSHGSRPVQAGVLLHAGTCHTHLLNICTKLLVVAISCHQLVGVPMGLLLMQLMHNACSCVHGCCCPALSGLCAGQ
jgi:hypothetical protein